jgi:hypothetical protein
LTGQLLYHVFLDIIIIILAGYLAAIKWHRYKERGDPYLKRLGIIFTIFALITVIDTLLDVGEANFLKFFEVIHIKHLMVIILLLLLIWGFRPTWKRPLKERKERESK